MHVKDFKIIDLNSCNFESGLMVHLYEYQGKKLLKSAGVLVPWGDIASTPIEAATVAEKIGKPVAVKAQILTTGRFKAGGVKFAETPNEAEKAAEEIISSKIKGFTVEKVLVEEKLDIINEFYASIVIDDSYKTKGITVMFSTEGGVNIEETIADSPERMSCMKVDILRGIETQSALELASNVGVSSTLLNPISHAICGLYKVFREYDAHSIEVNPLVIAKDGKIYAADCRIRIDDSSVFRHPELEVEVPRESNKPLTELDRIGWKIEETDFRGVSYFMQLNPEINGKCFIGYHGVGGGAAMLGIDALARQGIEAANYADTSGNPTASKVYRCAKVILSQQGIEGYFVANVNIASQEMWHSARGIAKAFKEELKDKPGFPVIVVWGGNKVMDSSMILKEMTKDLPICLEIYAEDPVTGPHYNIYNIDPIAKRMKHLVKQYRKSLER